MRIAVRLLSLLVLAVAAAAGFACGSGESSEFEFTPVPYTTFPEAQCESISCSRSYYLSEACDWNAADQVQLVVRSEERNAFVGWMSEQGFVIQEEYNRLDDNTVVMLVVVPLGSVPDAVADIGEQAGIVLVNANSLVFPADDLPAFIEDCRKTRAAGE